MKLATQTLELDSIRTDGDTQVRETLSADWVAELRGLYEDGGHSIPPLLVVLDSDGAHWLADGFHRLEALRLAGKSGGDAVVRHGSVDMARALAAEANKNGLPRTDGDKKRAILMLLRTAEGKRLNQEQIARHVGCTQQHVSTVITGGTSNCENPSNNYKTRVEAHGILHARIDAELRRDSRRGNEEVARAVSCSPDVVLQRRRAMGLPSTRGLSRRRQGDDSRAKARVFLDKNPSATLRDVADAAGCGLKVAAEVRESLGIESKRGPRPSGPPSAPRRKSGDPRDGADAKVLPVRPRSDPKVMQWIQIFESMTNEQRGWAFVAAAKKWPTWFGVQPAVTERKG